MTSITKLTKAQLIQLIEEYEDNKFDSFKEELGMPYTDDEDWINYIKNLQSLNAERLNDVQELTNLLEAQRLQQQEYLHNSHT